MDNPSPYQSPPTQMTTTLTIKKINKIISSITMPSGPKLWACEKRVAPFAKGIQAQRSKGVSRAKVTALLKTMGVHLKANDIYYWEKINSL